MRDVARELGINHETLRNWVTRARKVRAANPAVLGNDEWMKLAWQDRGVLQLQAAYFAP